MRKLLTGATLLLFLAGCSASHPMETKIEELAASQREQSVARIFSELDKPYLGGTPIPRATQDVALGSPVSFRGNGPLDAVLQGLASVTPLSVRADLRANAPTPKKEDGETESRPDAIPHVSVNYSGSLRGLLDKIADSSGTCWEYQPSDGVTFYKYAVKTYTLLSAPGLVKYENTITNRNREASVTSGLGGGGGGEASAQSQTSQTNSTAFQSDVWSETEKAVQNILSSEGKVTSNPAMGTITVADRATVIRQVSTLIDSFNTRMSRQIAYAVHAWALDVSDSQSASLDVAAVLRTGGISLSSSLADLPTEAGQLSATIVSGRWQGTTAIASAMAASGKATQIGGGSGITMNNHPAPIQNVKTQGYVQSVSSAQSDINTTYTITPAEITHGFSMTIIPHILDRRRLILQYNVNLSVLDRMEDFSIGDMRVQLPTVSTKTFAQQVSMRMGQTLILAGFIQDRVDTSGKAGLLNLGASKEHSRTMILITIDVESFGEPLMDEDPSLVADHA